MTTNMYKLGDYVYIETAPTMPYQIRRIEELFKSPSGNVEAKVMCYFRRRDIPSSLLQLADKHQISDLLESESDTNASTSQLSPPLRTASPSIAPKSNCTAIAIEPEGETDIKNEENSPPTEEMKIEITKSEVDDNMTEQLTSKQRYQLKQRELFLSRQVETLPATNIRGKCSVTLLNETESFSSYLDKEDAFFYTRLYDPQQRTLLTDHGEIRVGSRYQAEPTALLKEGQTDGRNMEELEVLTWTPNHGLSDREIDQFLVIARSVGTFARALDCSSSVKQPSLHMSAAAASRDITLFHAMDTLHQCNYDLGKAVCSLVPPTGPILCRDQMEEWSASEANLFEEALEKYGKDFNDVRQDFLPWKTPSNLIEYYYLWKTTDRYVQQKRVKAVEAESKLKQVYVPNYTKHPSAIIPGVTPPSKNGMGQIEISMGSGKCCECCGVTSSIQWYAWGPMAASVPAIQSQSRLCQSCWSYWKKYGDLKIPNKSGMTLPVADEETKVFPSIPETLTSRPHRCSFQGCGKEFKLKSHLLRHCAAAHGMPMPPGSPRPMMKTRTAFYLAVTPTTRLARRFCSHLLRPRHAARFPFLPVNSAAIKQEFQLRLSRKSTAEVNALLSRAQKSQPVQPRRSIRVSDLTFRLARGQIHSVVPNWLILPDRSSSKSKPEHMAFPPPPKAPDGSLIYERVVLPPRDPERLKRRPDDHVQLEMPPSKRATRESPAMATVTPPLPNLAPIGVLPAGVIPGSTSPAAPLIPNLSGLQNLPGLQGIPPLTGLVPPNLRPNIPLLPLDLYGLPTPVIPGLPSLNPASTTQIIGSSKLEHSPLSAVSPSSKSVATLQTASTPFTAGNKNHGGGRVSGPQQNHGQSGRVKQLPTWMDAPDDLFFHSTQATKKLRRQLATQELRRAARKPWRPLLPLKA